MTDIIRICLGDSCWLAIFPDDRGTVPLPFTARAALADVIADVQRRNPGSVVRHWLA